jgi:hypothetical protein
VIATNLGCCGVYEIMPNMLNSGAGYQENLHQELPHK